jgi:hypothetical protein
MNITAQFSHTTTPPSAFLLPFNTLPLSSSHLSSGIIKENNLIQTSPKWKVKRSITSVEQLDLTSDNEEEKEILPVTKKQKVTKESEKKKTEEKKSEVTSIIKKNEVLKKNICVNVFY